MELQGKVAIVTGGASGIGLQMVRHLLQAGLKGVAILDMAEAAGKAAAAQMEKEFGAKRAVFIQVDVTKADQLKEAFKKASATFGGLDIVINNAGVINEDNWELTIAINVDLTARQSSAEQCCAVSLAPLHSLSLAPMPTRAPHGRGRGAELHCLRPRGAAAPAGRKCWMSLIYICAVMRGTMLAMEMLGRDRGGRGGTVLNVASILGLSAIAGGPAYVASKHAVVGLVRSYGMPFHWERSGVRVLALCPGVTDTPLVAGAAGPQMSSMGQLAAQELAALPQQKPDAVGRATVEILRRGEPGSLWVAEGGQPPYQVLIPPREQMRV